MKFGAITAFVTATRSGTLANLVLAFGCLKLDPLLSSQTRLISTIVSPTAHFHWDAELPAPQATTTAARNQSTSKSKERVHSGTQQRSDYMLASGTEASNQKLRKSTEEWNEVAVCSQIEYIHKGP